MNISGSVFSDMCEQNWANTVCSSPVEFLYFVMYGTECKNKHKFFEEDEQTFSQKQKKLSVESSKVIIILLYFFQEVFIFPVWNQVKNKMFSGVLKL